MALAADGHDAAPARSKFKRDERPVDDQRQDLGGRHRQRLHRGLANPKLDAVEVWKLANPSGGWFHPVHIHLIDFKILSRNGGRNEVFDYERGPKDVVYVGENETAAVIASFGPQPGGT